MILNRLILLLTGIFFIDNLQDGAYNIKFSGGNYTLKSYDVTVADRSTQTLKCSFKFKH